MDAAKLINDAGISCICAFTAPSHTARERAAERIAPRRFVEVFVDTPLELCRERDKTGVYKRAEEGEISMLPGLTGPYDRPLDPDLSMETTRAPALLAADILALLGDD